MNQPITALFSSQSTEGEKLVPEEEDDDDDDDDDDDEVKKVHESVNLKVEALKYEMSKEVAKIEQTHSTLHDKIDVVIDAIKKLVEHYTSFTSKFDAKTDVDSKVFSKMEDFWGSLNESISKIDTSHTSSISQEYMSQIFSSLETNLKVELAPLLKCVNMMPTDAPSVNSMVQGGIRGLAHRRILIKERL
ncbi:unnamed protein product [Lactuca saligna]|uniref:Uncharacterized protein n=1 Tax=Lactuca saligna TaxID=75948 RepID=A0AA35ZA10_LACSI|nr:unnamed protein product [Lactuca saligna]